MRIWAENIVFSNYFMYIDGNLTLYSIHNGLSMGNYSTELLVRKKQVKMLKIYSAFPVTFIFSYSKSLIAYAVNGCTGGGIGA